MRVETRSEQPATAGFDRVKTREKLQGCHASAGKNEEARGAETNSTTLSSAGKRVNAFSPVLLIYYEIQHVSSGQ